MLAWKQIFAGIFEQARIALPSNNLVVDASRFFTRSNFTHQAFGRRPRLQTLLSKLIPESETGTCLRVSRRCRFGRLVRRGSLQPAS